VKGLTRPTLATAVCLLAVYALSFSQGSGDQNKKPKPDLSGVWVFDPAKSNLDSREKITDYVLTIVHREPEIKMTARFKQNGRDVTTENRYYTDGRRVSFLDPDVSTRWRGTKLTMVSSVRAPIDKVLAPEGIVTTVEWELSSDGKILTRTTRMSGMVVSKSKAVFNRSS
jgi:hypothetical protein